MGWEQLLAIQKEQAEAAQAERTRRPSACPEDGTPLDDDGTSLHCRFCGWMDPPSAAIGRPR
jgi:hypothetical protein